MLAGQTGGLPDANDPNDESARTQQGGVGGNFNDAYIQRRLRDP